MKKSIKITLEAYRILRKAQKVTVAKQYRLSELAIKAAFGELTGAEEDALRVFQKAIGKHSVKKGLEK